MSALPRVVEATRERVSREFDSLGPEVCVAQISAEMTRNNPELLDMARRCARDVTPAGGDPARIMIGFVMFYRLLLAQWEAVQGAEAEGRAARSGDDGDGTAGSGSRFGGAPWDAPDGPWLNPLPCVTPEVREALVQQIDDQGAEVFTVAALEEIDFHNPQLLNMAHGFAMRHGDYIGIMQGFGLLYMALSLQADADRESMQ